MAVIDDQERFKRPRALGGLGWARYCAAQDLRLLFVTDLEERRDVSIRMTKVWPGDTG
jgi:hypothetical protein